ncbi:unnamed protein product [Linum trigynum]|uniref:Uncharacterized protein n=1 Tax=Linum trigynum TaxID=586398 RepID=A0AAV2EQW1_9ROSI
MESESSRPAGGSRDKETSVQPTVEELQTQIEQLKAQIKTLTSGPPPNGVHGSSSQQQETPGGSAQPNGTSAPPPPSPPDLSYLAAHLTPGFLGDPGHGRPLAQTILEQPNPPNFQMPHHLPEYYGTSDP